MTTDPLAEDRRPEKKRKKKDKKKHKGVQFQAMIEASAVLNIIEELISESHSSMFLRHDAHNADAISDTAVTFMAALVGPTLDRLGIEVRPI